MEPDIHQQEARSPGKKQTRWWREGTKKNHPQRHKEKRPEREETTNKWHVRLIPWKVLAQERDSEDHPYLGLLMTQRETSASGGFSPPEITENHISSTIVSFPPEEEGKKKKGITHFSPFILSLPFAVIFLRLPLDENAREIKCPRDRQDRKKSHYTWEIFCK